MADPELKWKGMLLSGTAIGIWIASIIVNRVISESLGSLMFLAAWALMFVGIYFITKAKRYHPAFTLLGLLHFIGVIIAMVIPDTPEGSRLAGK